MKGLKFKQVDVFTDTRFCGNPAAVVLDAAGLRAQEMQTIAREMNLSETVFISPPTNSEADYLARIFTPRSELPFAGHPTIATAHAVVEEKSIFKSRVPELVRQECGIGVVPISVERRTEGLFFMMTQAPPQWTAVTLSDAECAAMLGCAECDLAQPPPEIVSTGVKWLIVPFTSLRAVAQLKPDQPLIERVCARLGALGVTVFCLEARSEGRSVHARTFAPGEGVAEDPVCGSGQGSIAAYIAKYSLLAGKTFEYLAEQGTEVQRPGTVTVKATLEETGRWTIQVGGQAVTVMSGEIFI